MGLKGFKVYASAYNNEVTGSRCLIVIERPDGLTFRVLIDCGYYQEEKYKYLNYVDDLSPEKIDAIIITHNHIDHTGLLPKFIRKGYRKKIYMTEITKTMIGDYLNDSAKQEKQNVKEMSARYPDAPKFKVLHDKDDVSETLKHCVGIGYRKTIEILPRVRLTFWENAHILGAAMVLLQCSYPKMKPMNYLFSGDFKFENEFIRVPEFPEWFRKMELIMFTESTYGTTKRQEIKECFRNNVLEAFERQQDILIGAFALDRMQRILYDFKIMQDEGLIPPNYVICCDGPLGIATNHKYQAILETHYPDKKDFMPKGIKYMNGKSRESIFDGKLHKIVITTSGMLDSGPARMYVPMFLTRENALIHLVGYAAEGTLARKLLNAKRSDTVKIGSHVYKRSAVIKTTREKSSHATGDELIEQLINRFSNVQFLGIQHGNTEVREAFYQDVMEQCPNVKAAGIINRERMYVFSRIPSSDKDADDKIDIKVCPTGMINDDKMVFGPKVKKNRKKLEKKQHKKIKKVKGKRKKK